MQPGINTNFNINLNHELIRRLEGENELPRAIIRGDINFIRREIGQVTNQPRKAALLKIAFDHNVSFEIVRLLMDAGAEVNLAYLIFHEEIEWLKMLLEDKRIDLNATHGSGDALCTAMSTSNPNPRIVDLFLSYGAKVNGRSGNYSYLDSAIFVYSLDNNNKDKLRVAAKLLEKGAAFSLNKAFVDDEAQLFTWLRETLSLYAKTRTKKLKEGVNLIQQELDKIDPTSPTFQEEKRRIVERVYNCIRQVGLGPIEKNITSIKAIAKNYANNHIVVEGERLLGEVKHDVLGMERKIDKLEVFMPLMNLLATTAAKLGAALDSPKIKLKIIQKYDQELATLLGCPSMFVVTNAATPPTHVTGKVAENWLTMIVPKEIWLKIFSYLDIGGLLAVVSSNKYLIELTDSEVIGEKGVKLVNSVTKYYLMPAKKENMAMALDRS